MMWEPVSAERSMWRRSLSECLRAMGVDADLRKHKGPLRAVADQPPATVADEPVATVVVDAEGRVVIRCAPPGAAGRTAVVGKTLAGLIVEMAND